MAKMKTFSGPAALTAAKKAGLNVRKATAYEAFEKKDRASDRKAGVKEGSKADMKKDAKMGLKMRGGGCVSRTK